MRVRIHPHRFTGTFRAPASKSHTIRRLLMAALTEGVSEIEYPLDSLDARSCAAFCRALGAEVEERRGPAPDCPNPPDGEGNKLTGWIVRGRPPGVLSPGAGKTVGVDVGNSGTTLFLGLGAAALGTTAVEFDGDGQIRGRGAGPLLEALSGLGVSVRSAPGGRAPIMVKGPWKGGRVSLPSPTSQYLSALLLAAPLAPPGTVTEIEVPLLNERPYIEMTLAYLDAQGVRYETDKDFSFFRVPGGAGWKPLGGAVSGDFSSAAFPAAAAALRGGPVTLLGLDPGDTQGDKVFFDYLREMGCEVQWEGPPHGRRLTLSRSGPLKPGVFDLNATPDLFPVMAVLGAAAAGAGSLINAAHARIKETDRIAGMAEELARLGVKTEERPDGLVIHGRPDLFPGSARPGWDEASGSPPPSGAAGPLSLDGRGDHRVVMALAVLALAAPGPLEIEGAESAAVTYPGFLELLKADMVG